MVHSFAKKKLKAKKVNQCANQCGLVAKFISGMQGTEPHILESKMKGKQMTSNQSQLHKELTLQDGQGQRSTAGSNHTVLL